MKRKRFVKLMMGAGYSRNQANTIAGLLPAARRLFPRGRPAPEYARTWDGFCRLRQEVTAPEA